MTLLVENIWMLLTFFMAGMFIWSVYSHHKGRAEKIDEPCGTLHCPYCGSTVGVLKDGESATDLFFVEEVPMEDEAVDDELPDNVIPFTKRAQPLFVVDDDDPYVS